MKKNLTLSLSILVMLNISCNNLDEKLVQEIRVSHTQVEDSFSNAIKSYEIVALDNNPDAYISIISSVLMKDSLIFIGDYKRFRVVIFDKSGKYIGSVGNKGRGPGEVISMYDFSIDDNNSISIYDRNTVKEYSISGEMIKSNNLGFIPSKVATLKTGQMVFASNVPRGNPETDFAIRLTDNKLRTIDSRLPIQSISNNAFVGQSDRLQLNADHAYFFSYAADTIYHINNKSIVPVYYFSYDKKALVSFDLNPSMYFDQGDTYYDLHYYEIDDNCLLFFCYEGKYYCLIINIKTNEARVFNNSIPFVGVVNNFGIVTANSMNLEQTIKKYIDPKMEKCTNIETLNHVIENKTDDIQIIIKISLND